MFWNKFLILFNLEFLILLNIMVKIIGNGRVKINFMLFIISVFIIIWIYWGLEKKCLK